MGQVTQIDVQPMQAAREAHALHWWAADSRTLRWCVVELVLPALTVVAMSVLTAVLLVLVVSAVADMELSWQARPGNLDPWAAACFGSTIPWNRQMDAESGAGMGELVWDEAGTAEPWPGSLADDRLDVSWARWTPQ
ncbi:MAG: hypothetical protein JW955_25355 [Sedimentisphaerales bacterium]|nr:hypothetical protein [Sedimentisphaerales bacterium]